MVYLHEFGGEIVGGEEETYRKIFMSYTRRTREGILF